MAQASISLTELARLGFTELDAARAGLGDEWAALAATFAVAADPDKALRYWLRLAERDSVALAAAVAAGGAERLIRILGVSRGLGEFLLRDTAALTLLHREPAPPAEFPELQREFAAVVQEGTADAATTALRVAYRRRLLGIAAWDVAHPDPLLAIDAVTAGLADLAGAALDAALRIARRSATFPTAEVAATPLGIIGMGKCGARELNYVSDVDVIFVTEQTPDVTADRAVEISTRLAVAVVRIIHEPGKEPGLWEVDTNLRPEGKDGALVRTLDSHVAYYERWAKGWEFQALLKARPIAGDFELGDRFTSSVAPMVWASAARENFVESVQRMRERVTENIPADELDVQLKLGPGGLRDIEFTVQLLQLVHGRSDERVRAPGSIAALSALADAGYVGRAEAAEFGRGYRLLRLLEHRLQLAKLSRTHLMPRGDEELRVLARATGFFAGAPELVASLAETRGLIRSLHERLFYRPLLAAVASLPGELSLSNDQAEARLAAIGFRDPRGALRHIAALGSGMSRRAAIQRTLLPVILQWLSEGTDPDFGLLAFRRLSDDLGESPWFLRMLRDSSGAAQRLTTVVSSSRFVGGLFERIPEAAAWLDSDEELQPRPLPALLEETRATIARHLTDPEAAAAALRNARRREYLRMALATVSGVVDIDAVGHALSDITTATLTGFLELARTDGGGSVTTRTASTAPFASAEIDFAIIAMGRYGGGELGFGSDADVMYVYRPRTADTDEHAAQSRAESIVHNISRLAEDLRLPLELDIGLRPEGKNGAIVRSLESYRSYYARWSLTWEAQALLRARGVVGDEGLLADFAALADEVRYPTEVPEAAVREVRRIKARVESERLPQGADPTRHVKLGRGSLSDVEWCVQLLQLQHAATTPALRTTSTLAGLEAAADAGFLTASDAMRLRAAWLMASRVRSAMTLWENRTTDVLPRDRQQLEGIARLLGFPRGSASRVEDEYLRVTRLARQVFDRVFYG